MLGAAPSAAPAEERSYDSPSGEDGSSGDGISSSGRFPMVGDGSSRDPHSADLADLIESVVDYDDPSELWDEVRQWLRAHGVDEITAAAERKDESDATVLHVACRECAPADVVEVMLVAAPDMAFWSDSSGWLPLHYACANGAGIAVTELLLNAFPEGRIHADKRGRTPLHFALGNVGDPPTTRLVRLLLDGENMSEQPLRWPDENAMLPIHYACAYGTSVEVLTALIEPWDESLQMTDSRGRTPLHFAMGNSDRENSPKVVNLLLELCPGAMEQLDDKRNLPLHLLSSKARTINERQFQEKETISKCLRAYLSAKPITNSEFLAVLQNMPEWLRDVAVIAPEVQTMLNDKVSSRFPTMILLLDSYFLAAVIAVFSYASRQSMEQRFNPKNESLESRSVNFALLSPLYIGALYFLGREMTQMISVRKQTTIVSYLFDPENIRNLVFIFLTVYYTILMNTGLGNDDRFRVGCAFTIGFCYLQVLAYLKSILIEFAVFVSGVMYIVSHLVAFFVCVIIMLAASSQMWYTLFRQSSECLGRSDVEVVAYETNPPPPADDIYYYDDAFKTPEDCEVSVEYPYCEGWWWAFLKTFTMFLGEYDETLFVWDSWSLFVFLAFYFIGVIICMSILIAIIIGLQRVVTNERAEIVFWSNRLAFLTDMDMITNGPWKKVTDFFKIRDDSDDEEEETSLIKRDEVDITRERILWKKLIEFFDPDLEYGMGAVIHVPLRIFVSTFLIPFWLLLGILSAGLLWPPQIREGLFVQKVSVPGKTGEVHEIKKRIEEVEKLMKNLDTLKGVFVHETMTDRKDMIALKIQVKDIKTELKNEVKYIKGVMTSLFEVQQQAMSRER